MSIRATPLSTILARMQRFQDVLQNSNEIYQVRDIDQALRSLRRMFPLPWTIQKSSMRVFEGIKEYPVATDHDELAYLDRSDDSFYPAKARFKYTSLNQFYEDPNNRNQIAEIWDGNQRFFGVNYKNFTTPSQVLNTAESTTGWTVTGDAGTPVLDQVFFKEGNASIQIPITLATSTAGVRWAFSSVINDSSYKKKYAFVSVYLAAVPTSIEFRIETSATAYVSTSGITTQFSGQPLKAGQWNTIAIDLNTATVTGAFDSTSIGFGRLVFTGAATGTYFVDASYFREWVLLDYWYYSINTVKTSAGTLASKEYFYDDTTTPAYDLTDLLVGDSEWADVIMYDACLTNLIDIKANKAIKDDFKIWRSDAWAALGEKYPSLEPIIITDTYNFIEDFVNP